MVYGPKSRGAKKVAVVGARGYSGLELARLLMAHPEAELAACFAHDKPFRLSDYLPEAAAEKVPVFPLAELTQTLPNIDTVFLATPAEASLELVPRILAAGSNFAPKGAPNVAPKGAPNVIDLSGAFRFRAGTRAERAARFEVWYKTKHTSPELDATYGLAPFARPARPGGALVANPGCYATAVLMAIVPLLKAGAILPSSLVIDAKSGTSGAGRKAAEGQLFNEVDGECLPYKVGAHQHLPEIEEWAEAFGGARIEPFFATHLLPVRRGIIASIYAELAPGANVAAAYASAFAAYPLARVTKLDGPASQELSPTLSLSLKRVVGTARTHISYRVVGNKLYVFSLIDNLLKGAASQAVENFNSLHDLPLAVGLDGREGTL